MRTFETTNIVSPVNAPITKRSLEHINAMAKEPSSEIAKALMSKYTANDVVVLNGCVVTATIPGTSSVTSGAVYYNGDVYQVDANASIITTGLQTLVWVVEETADTATFSDGVAYDFHIINKMKLQAGLSGSGLSNYDSVKKYRDQIINSASNSDFAISLDATGCSGSITDASYSLTKIGNQISFIYRVEVTISSVGGGGKFFNIKITPKTEYKCIASQGLLVSTVSPIEAALPYDKSGNGYLASDSSGNISTQYTSANVATVDVFTFNVTGNYLTQ